MERGRSRYFCVAGHRFCLLFRDETVNSMRLLPSFANFEVDGGDVSEAVACKNLEAERGELLFTLIVDDTLSPAPQRCLVRKFDTGNGDTIVYQLPDGGYQYIIRDILGNDCCLLIADKSFGHCQCALHGDWTMRSFGLNNALMLVYAFAGSYRQTLLIHASATMLPPPSDGGEPLGFPFIASSGTGKSTHTSLWLRYVEGAELLNDDNPILRIEPEGVYIYGSPWSGKTPCYRNRRARLAAVTRIERAPSNSIERQKPVAAFASLLPACSSMKWDEAIYRNLCDAITHIVESTPIYTLYCLPDEGAARLSFETLAERWIK